MRFRRIPRPEHGDEPKRPAADEAHREPEVIKIDSDQLRELSAVFTAPRWLRDIGVASWLLVGVAALLAGLIALLAATSEIVQPVIAGLVVATVAVPLVGWLERRRVPRAAGAALVLLGLVVLAVGIVLLVIGGITSQEDSIQADASDAADKIQEWLKDLGLSSSGASTATESTKTATSATISTLVHGLVTGVAGIASLAFALSFAALSVFFLLKDGPMMRAWVDRHLGAPQPVAQTITGEVIKSLRRYFGGVTIVAGFNAAVVGVASVILDVPLAGTIAVVTFVTAYIPYIGAFVAGAFAVVLALGSEGTTTAVIMLVVVILANGALQQIVQPIAFGATLDLNPLVVLVVTIGAGCLFGMIGLVLAAPLTSAVVHISADLARVRAAAAQKAGRSPPDVAGEPTTAPV
jgi:predicted PurR-regulated permease PerM